MIARKMAAALLTAALAACAFAFVACDDPDDAENSARPRTRDELVQATWGNFNGLKGGHYGA